MKNIEIPIDESLLAEVDLANQNCSRALSEVVEEALRAWLMRRKANTFEQEWIAALKINPDGATRAEVWREAQAWSNK